MRGRAVILWVAFALLAGALASVWAWARHHDVFVEWEE